MTAKLETMWNETVAVCFTEKSDGLMKITKNLIQISCSLHRDYIMRLPKTKQDCLTTKVRRSVVLS